MATVSASDGWAVGSAEDSLGNDQLLAEHWDGTAWTIVRTPTVVTGDLSALAAISSNDVWAGGSMLLSARGWRLGRIIDPFGLEWEIGTPLGGRLAAD